MTPRPSRWLIILPGLALALGGCVVGPPYRPAPPPTPASLAAPNAAPSQTPLGRVGERSADLASWWSQFADPQLDGLIARALAQNLDRRTAAARVREARETARIARAALFPTLNGDADAQHTHISQNAGLSSIGSLLGGGGKSAGGAGASGGGSGGSASSLGQAGFPGIEFDSYTLGLDAAWTPDVFGGARSGLDAALARAEAQLWSARDTEVAVAAEVAQAYFALRSAQAELSVLNDNVARQRDLLTIIQARARGGLLTEVDTVQQRAELETTQAQIPPLEASAAADLHQLAILLAEPPDVLRAELSSPQDPVAALPMVPAQIDIGAPAELLARRPDIRAAERQLAASVADVRQATAALYPRIQFSGSFDFVSTALHTLLEAESRNYSYGAALLQPLFDAGKLRAQKRVSEAQAEEAALAYRSAVLQALQQCADSLARYAADQRQMVVLASADADTRRAADLDRAQYLGGLADLQATLRAETSALQTARQLVTARAAAASDLVALYRALGGGWAADTDAARSKVAARGPLPHPNTSR